MKHRVIRQVSELSSTAKGAFIDRVKSMILMGLLLGLISNLACLLFPNLWPCQVCAIDTLIFVFISILVSFIARSLSFSLEDRKLQLYTFFGFISLQCFCLIGAIKSLDCMLGVYTMIPFFIVMAVFGKSCFTSLKHLGKNQDLLNRFNQYQFGSLAMFLLTSNIPLISKFFQWQMD